MTRLARDDVLRAIRGLLPALERSGDRVLVVGTASSLLRGIDLPAADVDILARDRAAVDELATAATASGGRCVSVPAYIENPGFDQYFAEFEMAGIRVELSTVEALTAEPQIGECIGDAPWSHYDVLVLEGRRVPVVASELRLLTEMTRLRPDRWEPIAAHLARNGYDEQLFAATIAELPTELREAMRAAIVPARPPSRARRRRSW